MAVGDPLSKTFTVGKVEDLTRIRVGVINNPLLTPVLFIDEIALSILKIQNILGGLDTRFYGTKIQTLTISGSANPYTVDMSGMTDLPLKISRVVHVTNAGVRTSAQKLDASNAQNIGSQSSNFAPSLSYVDMGDNLELWAQSSFTITTATDKIHLYYYRQAINSGMTRASKVDVLDVFVPFLVQDMVNKMTGYRDSAPVSPQADAALVQDIQSTWQSIIQGKQLKVEERP